MSRRLRLALLLPLTMAACQAQPAEPQVTEARITLPAVQGRPGAAYFTIKAGRQTRLAGLTSPRVERIELHESMAEGMGPLRDATVPAGGELSFTPGGRHAMLFGIDPALKAGQRLPLTFQLEGAPTVTVEAEVLGPGGAH